MTTNTKNLHFTYHSTTLLNTITIQHLKLPISHKITLNCKEKRELTSALSFANGFAEFLGSLYRWLFLASI